MATILPFARSEVRVESESAPVGHHYTVEISVSPNDFIEFTAKGVRTDAKALYKIAAELEKIASIIRSDVLTEINRPA